MNHSVALNSDQLDLLEKILVSQIEDMEGLDCNTSDIQAVSKILAKIKGVQTALDWK